MSEKQHPHDALVHAFNSLEGSGLGNITLTFTKGGAALIHEFGHDPHRPHLDLIYRNLGEILDCLCEALEEWREDANNRRADGDDILPWLNVESVGEVLADAADYDSRGYLVPIADVGEDEE